MKKNNFLYYIPASGRGRYENVAEKRPAQAAYKPNSNSLMPKGGLSLSFNDPILV